MSHAGAQIDAAVHAGGNATTVINRGTDLGPIGIQASGWYPLFPNAVVGESILDRVLNTSRTAATRSDADRAGDTPP